MIVSEENRLPIVIISTLINLRKVVQIVGDELGVEQSLVLRGVPVIFLQ